MKQNKTKSIQNESGSAKENETNCIPVVKQFPSPLEFLEHYSTIVSMVNNNAKDFLKLPAEERIAVLTKRIHYLNVIEAIFKLNVKGILETQLIFEKDCLESNRNSENGIYHLLTPDEILLKMKFNKMPIHGKMIDFGNKIGFILYNLKNSNGNHYIEFETVIVARWVCALFVQSNGEPLVLKTMQEYIAEGRKMELSDFSEGIF